MSKNVGRIIFVNRIIRRMFVVSLYGRRIGRQRSRHGKERKRKIERQAVDRSKRQPEKQQTGNESERDREVSN
jgi:hypothetical protein